MNTMKGKFYGKYRGKVTDVNNLGQVRATVPDVMGDKESGWAMPCLPFAGNKMGFFCLPQEGSHVWIEFEHGDPNFPIWSGCFWLDSTEVPAEVQTLPAQKIFIKTAGGHSVMLNDASGSGGITLQTSGGQKIAITSQGIEINDGNGATVKLSGPKVSINDTALEVT